MDFEVKEDKELTAQLRSRQSKPAYHFENISGGLALSEYKKRKQGAKSKYYVMLKKYFLLLSAYASYFNYPKHYSASEMNHLRKLTLKFLADLYSFTHPKAKHHSIFELSKKCTNLEIREEIVSDLFSFLLQMQDLIIKARYGASDYINGKEDNSKLNAAFVKLFTMIQENTVSMKKYYD